MKPVCFFGDAFAPNPEFAALHACLGRGSDTLGNDRTHLIAAGTGAATALRLAARRPNTVASLTLLAPEAANLTPPPGMSRAEASLRMGSAFRAASAWIDARHGPGTLARSPLAYQNIAIDRVSGALSAAKSACLNPLSDRELAAISALTLLVLGPTAPVGRLSTVPFLRLERFNSTEPHVLEPHLVHPMIREFLARAERGWQDGTGPVDLAA